MTSSDIIVGGIMLMVLPCFICLPFYVVKLRAEEAVRNPKDLPSVKRHLWLRMILFGFSSIFFLYQIIVQGRMAIWNLAFLPVIAMGV